MVRSHFIMLIKRDIFILLSGSSLVYISLKRVAVVNYLMMHALKVIRRELGGW